MVFLTLDLYVASVECVQNGVRFVYTSCENKVMWPIT